MAMKTPRSLCLRLHFNTFIEFDFIFLAFPTPFPHFPTTEAENKETQCFMKQILGTVHVLFWLGHLCFSRILTSVTS